ncbi:hypothetical protein [Halomarina halobia]|uniref:Uncharacterized protein n=1 Tax=Halomarina halobia TaxID=3033386 RepID=A0ABD6A9L4_9EURY
MRRDVRARVGGDGTVRHREAYRYTDRGTTEVPRPAWLDEAANETDGRAIADDRLRRARRSR